MKYLITIPAYNEGAFIESVVSNSLIYGDVLVVDDGSSDNTLVLAQNSRAKVINHEKNKGKGAALKTGIKYGLEEGYDVIIMLDGDGQHDPKFVPELVRTIREADLIICSRFLKETPKNMAIGRRMSNKLTTWLLEKATGYHITDSQCGFRVFNEKAAKIFVEIPYDDYEFESEMLYQASINNLVYKEIGIPSSYRGEKSYITGIKIIKYIYYLVKLFFRKIRGINT